MAVEVYPNAPLALVAFEARFPEQRALATRSSLEELKGKLSKQLPLRDDLRQQEVVLAMGAEQPPAVQVKTIPRFTTRDRTTASQVSPTSVIIETTSYEGFGSFRSLVEVVSEAVSSVARPDGVTRIGLRYIDEIRVPGIDEPPGDWHEYIDEHLLAPVAEEFVKAAALVPRTWQGIVQYGTGPDRAVALRYGPSQGYAVPPGGPTRRRTPPSPGLFFLLDSDSYWEPTDEVPEFEAVGIVRAVEELHGPVKALFDTVVTNKLRDVFRLEPEREARP